MKPNASVILEISEESEREYLTLDYWAPNVQVAAKIADLYYDANKYAVNYQFHWSWPSGHRITVHRDELDFDGYVPVHLIADMFNRPMESR